MPTPRSAGNTPLTKTPLSSQQENKTDIMIPTPPNSKPPLSRPQSVLSRARTLSGHSQPPAPDNSNMQEETGAEMDEPMSLEPVTTPEPLSRFSNLQVAPLTDFELLQQMFEEDPSSKKAFLASGNFYKDDGTPWSLPVIRSVQAQMAEDLTLNKEYTASSSGLKAFTDAATRMLFGEDCPAILENRIGTFHTPGGTAAVFVGLLVLRSVYGFSELYIPHPTRGKYEMIVEGMGFNVKYYKYMDEDTQQFDTEAFLQALENADEQSIFMIVADSPTNPTIDGWESIIKVMWRRHLLPFFHISTQGMGTGNVWMDALPVRHFGRDALRLDMMVAQSFSKTFGLCDECVGCLCIIGHSRDNVVTVGGFVDEFLRETWQHSPEHGARVAATVINNPTLWAEWKDHLKTMAMRIRLMRHLLYQKMLANGTLWKHLTSQSGLFSTTCFTETQIECLRERYHIYMEKHGFINLSCLRTSTVDYIARSFHEMVQAREDMEEEEAIRQEEEQGREASAGGS